MISIMMDSNPSRLIHMNSSEVVKMNLDYTLP